MAAGHPLTAEAGAQVLREGGNAVDAAVCAVLTSFVTESPLTGFGAGGFMLVHTAGDGGAPVTELTDFFVAAGGADGAERGAELVGDPGRLRRPDAGLPRRRRLLRGPGQPGRPGARWPSATARCRSRGWSSPASSWRARASTLTPGQAYFHEILHPILTSTPEGAALYAPEGEPLREGDVFRFPDAGDAMERFAAEGAEPFYARRDRGRRRPTGCASAAAPSGPTTWPRTSRSSASPSAPASAGPRC